MSTPNFNPLETIPLNSSTSSLSVNFNLPQSGEAPDVMISNAGSNTAFVAFATTTATAVVPSTTGTLGATPVLSGAIMILAKGQANFSCAAITSTGTSQLYFTAGQGV
jgi:hypothetical protein